MPDDGQALDTVGKRLKHARVVLNGNVPATVVAPHIGVTNVTISRWENEATANIGADDLSNAARVYGVPLTWLANGGEPPIARTGKPLFEIKRSRGRDVARSVSISAMTGTDELDFVSKALDECRAKHRRAAEDGGSAEDLARLKARTESYVAIMLEVAAEQPGNRELHRHITEMLLERDTDRDDARREDRKAGGEQ